MAQVRAKSSSSRICGQTWLPHHVPFPLVFVPPLWAGSDPLTVFSSQGFLLSCLLELCSSSGLAGSEILDQGYGIDLGKAATF